MRQGNSRRKELVPVRTAGFVPPADAAACRILLVGDDDQTRGRLAVILAVLGHRVDLAASADEALRLSGVSGAHFDALVTDLIMPGLNGRQLAARLRKRAPGLGVLFLSGHADDLGLGAEVLDASTRWLRKPFTVDQFERELGGLPGIVNV